MTAIDTAEKKCREFFAVSPRVNQVFSVPTRNRPSFLYEYGSGDEKTTIILRLYEQLEAIVLEARFDIAADKHSFAPVINYCQFHSDPFLDPGCLVVAEDSSHSVYYKLSTPFDSVSAKTLEWMSDCASFKVKKHFAKLNALISGDFYLSTETTLNERKYVTFEPDELRNNIEGTKAVLTEAFNTHDNRNMVGENMETESNILFLNQIRYDDSLFWEKIYVGESGYLIVAIKPELRCCNFLNLSRACNHWTDRAVVGAFHSYSEDRSIWCTAPISLKNGPISYETFEAVERCLIVSSHIALPHLRNSSNRYYAEEGSDGLADKDKLMQKMELMDKLQEASHNAEVIRERAGGSETSSVSHNMGRTPEKDAFDSIFEIFSSRNNKASTWKAEDIIADTIEGALPHLPRDDDDSDDLDDFIFDEKGSDINTNDAFTQFLKESQEEYDGYDRCFSSDSEPASGSNV